MESSPALSWGQAPKLPFSLRSMADRVHFEIERSENGGLEGTPKKESVASRFYCTPFFIDPYLTYSVLPSPTVRRRYSETKEFLALNIKQSVPLQEAHVAAQRRDPSESCLFGVLGGMTLLKKHTIARASPGRSRKSLAEGCRCWDEGRWGCRVPSASE